MNNNQLTPTLALPLKWGGDYYVRENELCCPLLQWCANKYTPIRHTSEGWYDEEFGGFVRRVK